jgi:hypothetical protein
MHVLLWILQIVLAALYFAGGSYKVTNFDALANEVDAISRGGWHVLGALEIVCAVLLILPAAVNWMPILIPIAAAVLAVETLALAAMYAQYSTELAVTNPMVWAVVMGALAAFLAYGRFAIRRQ